MTRSDQELVEAVLGGDRAAYAALVRRYERAARATALRVLGDADAAQDAAQEAFVIAYEKLSTLYSRATFGPWLLKITHREAVRLGKKRRKTTSLQDADQRQAPERKEGWDPEAEELLAAVGRLPKQEHATVMLRYFQGRSVQEIADILGKPVGTVTKQLTRAHRRLKGWLE